MVPGHLRFPFFALLGLSLVVPSMVHAFSGGPPDGRTGAPGEGTCTACHASFPLNSGSGTLTVLDGPAEGYEPGQTYRLRVALSDPDASRWGFELTSLDAANAATGDLVSVDTNTQTSTAGTGREYVKHTSSGTALGQTASNEWSFDWVAPAEGTGAVTLWFAGNAANGNFSTSGDRIYNSSITFEEAAATSAPPAVADARLLTNVPNPFNPSTQIRFELDRGESVRLEIVDLRGRRVRTLVDGPRTPGRHEVTWNGRDDAGAPVASGVYRTRLIVGGDVLSRSMTLAE
ncbi:MAG TPA: choice-of-anchor V domain-containing protein [Candidatus Krumholzibacteria bacterium]|nr:choice-of-anchor V domain-containing protein [Candidatus Krumholzibacteria bacterium]